MRAAFPEWYPLDADAVEQVIARGTIALDANVLLQLYRLGNDERAAVLKVFRHRNVRSRLWVPYQAALEYQRNRLTVARGQGKAYEAVSKQVTSSANALDEAIGQNIKDKEVRQQMKDAVAAALGPVSQLVERLRSEHVVDYNEIRKADPIRTEIDTLLRDPEQVGPKPSTEELTKRIAESKARYTQEIPPGYSDATGPNAKKNPEGDYLIWAEILSHVKASDRPLIFVTNDTKEDWYELDDKNAIAPRTELKLEIADTTPHHYHQETLEGFLRLIKQYLAIDIADDTLTTVGRIGRTTAYGGQEGRARATRRTIRILEQMAGTQGFDPELRIAADRALDHLAGRSDDDDETPQLSFDLIDMITERILEGEKLGRGAHWDFLMSEPAPGSAFYQFVEALQADHRDASKHDTLELQAQRARHQRRKARHERATGSSESI